MAASVALALAMSVACAVRPSGPPEPVVSPTGIVYEVGTPPSSTRFSQTATLYLRSAQPERAAAQAEQGIEEDPENPIHYFLAGVARARMGEYTRADSLLSRAQRIYPAYELEIEPERAAAWAEAFNEGAEAYADGDMEKALRAWQGAVAMYDLRPEAHRNLAMLLTREAEYGEAADVYARALAGLERRPATRVLGEDEAAAREEERIRVEEALAELFLLVDRFAEAEPLLRRQLTRDPENVQLRQNLAAALVGQGRRDEAGVIYDDLLTDAELEGAELFQLGVALFRSGDFHRAAEAFGDLAERRPLSRDVWFNYANALFAAEAWETLVEVGDRIIEVDPLNENAGLIVARAHLEVGDQRSALEHLHRVDGAPVHVEGLLMRSEGTGTRVAGRVTGNEAEAGTAIRLRFTFYGDAGPIGSELLTLSSPAAGESEGFEFTFGMRAVSFRYEVDGSGL
jgi:tetratricopeptide (TPR) repeat protein